MPQPVVSVVIATHNRANHLTKALNSLFHQTLCKNKFEVFVIDNASTDETSGVVEKFSGLFTFIKYHYEAIPGANNARNIGWRNARGKYVAFMDDDAVASSDWLETIVNSFENINPKPGIIGGKVIPIWEDTKPNWIKGKLLTALSVVDYGEEPRVLNDNEYLFSVNMAFQGSLLERFGGFDNALGRTGKALTSNDEILIAKKIRAAGYQFYYHPQASVQHFIPTGRLTMPWFIKRYFSQGYSDALMWRIMESPTFLSRCKKISFYIYCFLRNPKYVLRLLHTPTDHDSLYKKLIAHAWLGFMKGIFA